MRNKLSWILVLILVSLPAIAALLHPGFFQSDDGEWMIIRFSAFHQAFLDGQFPVRWLDRLNYGYGYPVANFLYPGFMYAGELFKFLGFGFVTTIKLIFGLSMVGSAVFCFLWLLRFFDKFSSVVGSLFYLYTPYHLFDLYKRGSIGEVLAFAIVPFVLWQIERKSFFWTSLGAGFLILSHNTLSLLLLMVIVAYLISRGLAYAIYFLPAIMLGLGLSSFFWVPAFFELKYTVFYQTQIAEWNKYFAGVGLIGVSTIFILLLAVFFFVVSKIQIQKHGLAVLFFVVGLISVFFASQISTLLWKILPVSFVQFPFRFLSITILSAAFLAAVVVSQLKGKLKIILAIFILVLLAYSAKQYIKPSVFFDKGDMYYATNEATTTVQGEYMPIWVKNAPKEHFDKRIEISSGEIKNLNGKSNHIQFLASSEQDSIISINMIYFPGWKVTVDGKREPVDYRNDKGIMQIHVPKGQHTISANFSETPLRFISDMVSLFSILVIIFISKKSIKT